MAVLDFERVLSDSVAGCDGRAVGKMVRVWYVVCECLCEGGMEDESKREEVAYATAREGNGRDAMKEGANHENAKLTSLRSKRPIRRPRSSLHTCSASDLVRHSRIWRALCLNDIEMLAQEKEARRSHGHNSNFTGLTSM